MEELISIIVPVYNIERYLPRCLDSIYHQTYKTIEILLIDDGSTDRSGEICDEYARKDSRCRVFHQQNKGQWFARNTGQKASKGSFILFIDGDDYFHYDMIHQMHRAITAGEGYDVAVVGALSTEKLDEDQTKPIPYEWKEYTQKEFLTSLLSSNDYPHPQVWNKLFRKTCLDGIQSRPFRYSEDLDFVLRFFLKTEKAVGTKEVMYYWLKHDTQVSRVQNAEILFCKSNTEICRSVLESLPKNNEYRSLLLDFMYRQMAKWRMMTLNTEEEEQVCQACKEVYVATRKEYMKNNVTPALVKVVKILNIRHTGIWASILGILNKRKREPVLIKMLKKRGLVKTRPFP